MSATARSTARSTAARTTAARAGAARTGSTRAGAARTGTARTSTARSGTARSGTARTGTARTSSTGARPATSPARRSGPVHVRPQLRLVPTEVTPRSRPRRASTPQTRRAPFVLMVVALIAATALGLLALNTAIAVDSLQASQQRAANAERVQEIERLQQQVTSGQTPAQLAAAAAAAGMVPAGTAGHLVVEPDGSSTVRGTPEPAPAPETEPAGD